MKGMKPYGHVAKVLRRVLVDHKNPFDTRDEFVTVRRKGPESVVRRAARLVPNGVKIVDIEVYETREQWVRVFGEGRS